MGEVREEAARIIDPDAFDDFGWNVNSNVRHRRQEVARSKADQIAALPSLSQGVGEEEQGASGADLAADGGPGPSAPQAPRSDGWRYVVVEREHNGWASQDQPTKLSIGPYRLDLTCRACPEQYDVFLGEAQVGYLRLRHGSFRADFPRCGGETVYRADPLGDGIFEPSERERYLTEAVRAIDAWRTRPTATDASGPEGQGPPSGARSAQDAPSSSLPPPSQGSRVEELEAALKPFADFIRMYDAKPLRGIDDQFYGIHSGTEWEAALKLSDFRKALAALPQQQGD